MNNVSLLNRTNRTQTAVRAGRSSRMRGQIMLVLAIVFLVLLGFTGLALDTGAADVDQRHIQGASDAASLAAARQLAVEGLTWAAPPPITDPGFAQAIQAAHDYAQNNGYSTIFSAACNAYTPVGSPTSFSTTWFDQPVACNATTGFTTEVTMVDPAVAVGGQPLPLDCAANRYNCIQVIISHKLHNNIMGVFGFPNTVVSRPSSAYASPGVSSINTPPASALYLYEPKGPSGNPQRGTLAGGGGLTCAGGVTCPTLWTQAGTDPMIEGIDGPNKLAIPSNIDQIAVQSNGDAYIQAPTTICDPSAAATGSPPLTCVAGSAVGNKGLSMGPAATLNCRPPSPAPGTPPCTNGPGLQRIYTNETPRNAQTWTPTIIQPAADCGALVLNGQAIDGTTGILGLNVSTGVNPACVPPSDAPFTIEPGKYQYIVINHGSYEFAGGLYSITSVAPPGQIDHRNETNARDFDLCPGGGLACPQLTAGVWIGHGSGPFYPGSSGVAPSCTTTTSGVNILTPGADSGGGDATSIYGANSAFYLGSGSGGFVSTHEVSSISIDSPGFGGSVNVGDAPLLIDMENSGFIHLDGASGTSHFGGIAYQTPAATSGGVELNPGLAGAGKGALVGQVVAYSFTTFGSAGTAVDFSNGFGTATTPPTSSGSNYGLLKEDGSPGSPGGGKLISSWTLKAGASPGTETLEVNYSDEYKLDAYDLYFKVNGQSPPFFFSQGQWNPPNPGATTPAEPNGSSPSDANPVHAGPGNSAGYVVKKNGPPNWDWIYTIVRGSGTYTIEVNGPWMWGHEADLGGAKASDLVTVDFTFPTPLGSTVNLEALTVDGDRCGDYMDIEANFANIGQPGGGQQIGGTVSLEQ